MVQSKTLMVINPMYYLSHEETLVWLEAIAYNEPWLYNVFHKHLIDTHDPINAPLQVIDDIEDNTTTLAEIEFEPLVEDICRIGITYESAAQFTLDLLINSKSSKKVNT